MRPGGRRCPGGARGDRVPRRRLGASAGSGQAASEILLNARTLKAVATLGHGHGQVYDVAFSPDGKTVAAAFDDGTVSFWDSGTHRRIRTVVAATNGPACDLAFSPDGRYLAVGGSERVVRLIDVRTGRLTAVLDGHSDRVNRVAFSPDGQTLASASADGYVLLWSPDPRRAVQRRCQALRGPTLAKEWTGLHAGIGPRPVRAVHGSPHGVQVTRRGSRLAE